MVTAQIKTLQDITEKRDSVGYSPYLWAMDMVPNIELEVSLYMLHSWCEQFLARLYLPRGRTLDYQAPFRGTRGLKNQKKIYKLLSPFVYSLGPQLLLFTFSFHAKKFKWVIGCLASYV
jgi:hypothetical protein